MGTIGLAMVSTVYGEVFLKSGPDYKELMKSKTVVRTPLRFTMTYEDRNYLKFCGRGDAQIPYYQQGGYVHLNLATKQEPLIFWDYDNIKTNKVWVTPLQSVHVEAINWGGLEWKEVQALIDFDFVDEALFNKIEANRLKMIEKREMYLSELEERLDRQ